MRWDITTHVDLIPKQDKVRGVSKASTDKNCTNLSDFSNNAPKQYYKDTIHLSSNTYNAYKMSKDKSDKDRKNKDSKDRKSVSKSNVLIDLDLLKRTIENEEYVLDSKDIAISILKHIYGKDVFTHG